MFGSIIQRLPVSTGTRFLNFHAMLWGTWQNIDRLKWTVVGLHIGMDLLGSTAPSAWHWAVFITAKHGSSTNKLHPESSYSQVQSLAPKEKGVRERAGTFCCRRRHLFQELPGKKYSSRPFSCWPSLAGFWLMFKAIAWCLMLRASSSIWGSGVSRAGAQCWVEAQGASPPRWCCFLSSQLFLCIFTYQVCWTTCDTCPTLEVSFYFISKIICLFIGGFPALTP